MQNWVVNVVSDDYCSSISTQPLMNVLSIIAFHNSIMSVVYEIVFHVELNISIASAINISAQSVQSIYQRSQHSQYISVVSIVNISVQSGKSIYQCSQHSQYISVVREVNISVQSAQSIYQDSQCSQYISVANISAQSIYQCSQCSQYISNIYIVSVVNDEIIFNVVL